MRLSLRLAAFIVLAMGSSAALTSDVMSEFEGLYIVSGRATFRASNDGPETKVKNATDCLVVKRVAINRAEVYLSSIQVQGYRCYLEGSAALIDGKLELNDEGAIALVPGQRAYLQFNGDAIRVSSSGPGPSYCGIHAGIEEISFPKKSRRSLPASLYASGAELSNACPRWNR